jgi:amidohydrolase
MRVNRKQLRELLSEAKRLKADLVSWRRHLHMNPEASMEEHDTAAFVSERLREIGIDRVSVGVGKTGVVGLIRGKASRAVGLRADMDALELQEANTVPYRSQRPGLMHACGHDAHVACLLGAASLLRQRRSLPGGVKFIFQPGEEGEGGARYMIADGVLDRPKMRAIAALHADTQIAAGKIGIRRGYDTAQAEDIRLVIRGRSAHAARPDQGVDSIAVASQALIAIQQFIARHTNSVDRKLVTFGIIRGGTRANVMADAVELIGTMRSLEPEGRDAVTQFLKRDLRKLVAAMGARMQLTIEKDGYPPSLNDDGVCDVVAATGERMLGLDQVVPVPKPNLGGEDFAYYGLSGIPAAMFRLGIRDEKKGFVSPGHSSTFDFADGAVLPVGAAMLAATAIELLHAF